MISGIRDYYLAHDFLSIQYYISPTVPDKIRREKYGYTETSVCEFKYHDKTPDCGIRMFSYIPYVSF